MCTVVRCNKGAESRPISQKIAAKQQNRPPTELAVRLLCKQKRCEFPQTRNRSGWLTQGIQVVYGIQGNPERHTHTSWKTKATHVTKSQFFKRPKFTLTAMLLSGLIQEEKLIDFKA